MRYKEVVASVKAQFAVPNGYKSVIFLVGKPGGGKSSCAREIARSLAEEKSIPPERIVEFNPSLREPCDILGLPDLHGEYARWAPPEEFWRIRAGQGASILIIEELSDATMDMQNPLCRVILDRHAGGLKLSEELYIIASGNRTEDRSGASRLSTKLSNRMRTIAFDENLEDWLAWAVTADIDPMVMAFLQWRPGLLSDFDPSRTVNPTPRSWEDVSRIPVELMGMPNGSAIYQEHVTGAVGEGAAAEFMGFRQVANNLPDYNKIKAEPETAPLPDELSTTYALCARIAKDLTKRNIDTFMIYIRRLPVEFQFALMKMAPRGIYETKAYQRFVLDNRQLLLGTLS